MWQISKQAGAAAKEQKATNWLKSLAQAADLDPDDVCDMMISTSLLALLPALTISLISYLLHLLHLLHLLRVNLQDVLEVAPATASKDKKVAQLRAQLDSLMQQPLVVKKRKFIDVAAELQAMHNAPTRADQVVAQKYKKTKK